MSLNSKKTLLEEINQTNKEESLIDFGFDSVVEIIYENNNDNKSIYSNLSKNMGIVLSINTVITTKIAGESIILSISNN